MLRQPKTKSSAEVHLIPWDQDSPTHVERLVQQRIACGWKVEMVSKWIGLQRNGSIAIQWVVLASTDPDEATKLETHKKENPKENSSLKNTAKTLIGKARVPSNETFWPVGHIGLNTEYESPGHDDGTEGLYWISNFYVSASLQGSGIGRAAMDAVESTAIAEPLNAKVLALSTVVRESKNIKEQWAALGREPPKVTNQDWYERRGYIPYKKVENMWWEADDTGKAWPSTAVFMKKCIV